MTEIPATEFWDGTWSQRYERVTKIWAPIGFLLGVTNGIRQLGSLKASFSSPYVLHLLGSSALFVVTTSGALLLSVASSDLLGPPKSDARMRRRFGLFFGLPLFLFFCFSMWRWPESRFLYFLAGCAGLLRIAVAIGEQVMLVVAAVFGAIWEWFFK